MLESVIFIAVFHLCAQPTLSYDGWTGKALKPGFSTPDPEKCKPVTETNHVCFKHVN